MNSLFLKKSTCWVWGLFFLSFFSTANADVGYDPWYTGPIVTGSGNNMDPGYVNVQPYLTVQDNYGTFDKHWHYSSTYDSFSVSVDTTYQTGITNWLDVTLGHSFSYNYDNHQHAVEYGDTRIKFGIQLLKDKKGTSTPSLRFLVQEIFPSGKYQNLNPKKGKTDANSTGAYETTFGVNVSKTVYWFVSHPMNLRFNLQALIPAYTRVHEYNVYGGGIGTDERYLPHYVYTVNGSFEYSFTQRWVFAMDFVYSYLTKPFFSGKPGLTPAGTAAHLANDPAQVISLAPAIEYNFNEDFGILGGVWFSVAGQNTVAFLSGVFTFTYTF